MTWLGICGLVVFAACGVYIVWDTFWGPAYRHRRNRPSVSTASTLSCERTPE